MKKILITRKLIKSSEEYASSLFDAKLNTDDKLFMSDDLINQSNDCDGILSTLTEKIDEDVISKLSNKLTPAALRFPIIYETLASIDFKIISPNNGSFKTCLCHLYRNAAFLAT